MKASESTTTNIGVTSNVLTNNVLTSSRSRKLVDTNSAQPLASPVPFPSPLFSAVTSGWSGSARPRAREEWFNHPAEFSAGPTDVGRDRYSVIKSGCGEYALVGCAARPEVLDVHCIVARIDQWVHQRRGEVLVE